MSLTLIEREFVVGLKRLLLRIATDYQVQAEAGMIAPNGQWTLAQAYIDRLHGLCYKLLLRAWQLGNKSVEFSLLPIVPLREYLRSRAAVLAGLIAQQIDKLLKRIIVQGAVQGKATEDIIDDVQSLLPTKPRSYASAIARTETHRMYNYGRAEQFFGNHHVVGYEIQAINDARTTPICRALDGKRFPISMLKQLCPPFHSNCRTTISPIFDWDVEEEGVTWDDIPAEVRQIEQHYGRVE